MSRIPAPVLALVLALAGGVGVHAAEPQKIAVFNPNRALFESPQGKVAIEKFEAERDARSKELAPMQKELRALEEKVNRDGPLMTEEQRATEEAKYRTLSQRLARRTAEINEDLNQRRQELLSGVESLVMTTARQYAVDNGFDLVLGPGVIYANKSIDMTDEVVKRMGAAAGAKPAQPATKPTPPAPAPKK